MVRGVSHLWCHVLYYVQLMVVIAEIEERIDALKLRLPQLEGKAHKRERSIINKEIYALENSPEYISAVKDLLAVERAAAAEAEDALHAARLVEEQQEAERRRQQSASTKHTSPLFEVHYRQQVEELFDNYAPKFERSLCVDLQYKTPQELERVLLERSGDAGAALSTTTCIDFGCGTGLMGVLLRPRCAGRLIGCDLSRGMLQMAAKMHAGVYDELVALDAVSYLRRQPAGSADLVVGADVCVYMRCLVDLISAAEHALCPGGLVAFSTEACELAEVAGGLPPTGTGWLERKSERIAHSAEYLRWLVSGPSSQLDLVVLEGSDIRNDGADVIHGHLVIMRKRTE